jgi:hypothetical protein
MLPAPHKQFFTHVITLFVYTNGELGVGEGFTESVPFTPASLLLELLLCSTIVTRGSCTDVTIATEC